MSARIPPAFVALSTNVWKKKFPEKQAEPIIEKYPENVKEALAQISSKEPLKQKEEIITETVLVPEEEPLQLPVEELKETVVVEKPKENKFASIVKNKKKK